MPICDSKAKAEILNLSVKEFDLNSWQLTK